MQPSPAADYFDTSIELIKGTVIHVEQAIVTPDTAAIMEKHSCGEQDTLDPELESGIQINTNPVINDQGVPKSHNTIGRQAIRITLHIPDTAHIPTNQGLRHQVAQE